MSRRRKTRSDWKLPMELAEIQQLALIHVGEYLPLGMELQKSSGVWGKANGRGTARFVFRSPAGITLVFTVRNITLASGAAG